MAIDLSAAGLGSLLVSVIGWVGYKFDTRLSKLEDESVTKEDFNVLRNDVREDVQGLHEKIDTKVDRMTERVLEAMRR